MRGLAPPPDPPELPEAARPRWRPWLGPVALLSSFAGIVVAASPILPVILISGRGDELAAVAVLVLILVQDSVLVGAALLFALIETPPRPWHFGLRATRLWPTLGWTALATALILAFEIGYVELLEVEETNVEEIGGSNAVAVIAVALAVIVVAPTTEELFFRGFFYRALRTRLRAWSASLVDGAVFGALHFQGPDSLIVLPVIAVFGAGACLLYERTGSLFAPIAVHAAFNAFATFPTSAAAALAIGGAVLAGCLIAPRRLGPAPSPFGRDPRARPIHA